MKMIFGKYIENNSWLSKIDARIKLVMILCLMILSFVNFNFFIYVGLFLSVVIFTLVGKLTLKPIVSFFKGMWLILLILLVINVLTSSNYIFLELGVLKFSFEGIIDTLYITLRLLNILLISNLLTASTNPSELTYAIEFYLVPLKLFKVDIHEIALMMSIAIRFVPTLMEEADKIMKAQTSRGASFDKGKYGDKIKSMISLIVPLFTSCFEKSDDLSEAILVKGYGIGTRSKYIRSNHIIINVISVVVFLSLITTMFVLNGVI